MSESQTAAAAKSGVPAGPGDYRLSDDLAKLCLPQEWKDSCRTLAWVNSVCALFLLVGIVGFKPPRVIVKPLSEVTDVVPVVFTPPEEPPKPDPTVKPDEPEEPPPDAPTETPVVAAVIAAVESPDIAFSVPVQGAVAVAATVRQATPPPAVTTQAAPPRPTQFNPSTAGGQGSFPPPQYPAMAQRNRYQGTAVIEIKVDESGTVESASVYKSSGFNMLDEAALEVVKTRWRFTPGPKRWLHWPCTFRMQ